MTRPRPIHPLIIYRPDLQSGPQRALYSTITMLAWLIWLYLFMPLIAGLGWWIGIEAFARYMLLPGGPDYLATLTVYAIVIAICALIILGWSRYNKLRFGDRDRRQPVGNVTPEMMQQRFAVSPDQLATATGQKIMRLALDDAGNIHRIEAGRADSGNRRAVVHPD